MATVVKTSRAVRKANTRFGNTPEGKVKRDIARVLDGLEGCTYHCPVPCGFGKAGVGDFVGCYKGRYFEIEAKAAGGKQSALQAKHAEEVRAAAGIYLLIFPGDVGMLDGLLEWESA